MMMVQSWAMRMAVLAQQTRRLVLVDSKAKKRKKRRQALPMIHMTLDGGWRRA
jgi:hypothetical protein